MLKRFVRLSLSLVSRGPGWESSSIVGWNRAKAAFLPPPTQLPLVLERGEEAKAVMGQGKGEKERGDEAVASPSLNDPTWRGRGGCKMSRGGFLPLLPTAGGMNSPIRVQSSCKTYFKKSHFAHVETN